MLDMVLYMELTFLFSKQKLVESLIKPIKGSPSCYSVVLKYWVKQNEQSVTTKKLC